MPTLDREGHLVARRVGLKRRRGADLYHFLVSGGWARPMLFISAFYFLASGVAVAFQAVPHSIAGARDGVFADAFFLSGQTFSTIGYGELGPATPTPT